MNVPTSRMLFATSVAMATVLAAAPYAGAATGPAGCLRDARRSANECGAECRETLQATKDGCINKDHDCVESCRAGRGACIDATGLADALDACDDTLATARATCRDTTPADSPARDACIDAAQQVAFQCRDSAREAAKPSVTACRTAFRTCTAACPAGTGTPAENPRVCRRTANRDFAACGGECREDLQVGRDACLHRDHDCVETCRDTRTTCTEPLRQQVRAALVDCAATRDAAVATCHTLYADGTGDLDQCIDNAQVARFTCGDQAHEAARPGLQACRAQFRDCAVGCPVTTP